MSIRRLRTKAEYDRLMERRKALRQTAQDLRVDAIAAGDRETEWCCEKQIEEIDKQYVAPPDEI